MLNITCNLTHGSAIVTGHNFLGEATQGDMLLFEHTNAYFADHVASNGDLILDRPFTGLTQAGTVLTLVQLGLTPAALADKLSQTHEAYISLYQQLGRYITDSGSIDFNIGGETYTHKTLAQHQADQDQLLTSSQQQLNNKISEVDSFVANAQPEKRIVQTLRIEGSSDYLYPVWFQFPNGAFGVGKLTISRFYGWNPGTLHPTHIASLLLELEGNGYQWAGDANFIEIKRFHERYNTTCSHVSLLGYARYRQESATNAYRLENSFGPQCPRYSSVYLRGGGLDYRFSANWNFTLGHSLESTLVTRSETHGSWYMEPIPLVDQIRPAISNNAYVDPI